MIVQFVESEEICSHRLCEEKVGVLIINGDKWIYLCPYCFFDTIDNL